MNKKNTLILSTIIAFMLLSWFIFETIQTSEESGCKDPNAINYNPSVDISDPESCEYDDEISSSSTAKPSIEWSTSVSGSNEESHGHFIMTCEDGGFLQIGETGFIPSSAKILVSKVDENGSFVWKQEFGSNGHNLGNSAIEVADGYIIVGSLDQNSLIMKLNKDTGSTIFMETHDNGGSDAYENIIKISNGYIAVGYIQADDPENTFYTEGTGYLVYLDETGSKTSEKNLQDHISHAYRIQSYEDEIFISGLNQDAQDYTLIKMSLNGDIIWVKTYGGENSDHNFAFDISSNGSIFLSGHTLSGTENWDTYTLKINTDGDVVWEVKKGNPRGFNPKYIHDEVWGAKATPDGGVIIVAGTGDEYRIYSECNDLGCSDKWHIYLIKFNSNGEIEWEATYSEGPDIDWAGEDICLTKDGGAVIAYDNGQFGFLKVSPI